jgi:hypothetical protein
MKIFIKSVFSIIFGSIYSVRISCLPMVLIYDHPDRNPGTKKKTSFSVFCSSGFLGGLFGVLFRNPSEQKTYKTA